MRLHRLMNIAMVGLFACSSDGGHGSLLVDSGVDATKFDIVEVDTLLRAPVGGYDTKDFRSTAPDTPDIHREMTDEPRLFPETTESIPDSPSHDSEPLKDAVADTEVNTHDAVLQDAPEDGIAADVWEVPDLGDIGHEICPVKCETAADCLAPCGDCHDCWENVCVSIYGFLECVTPQQCPPAEACGVYACLPVSECPTPGPGPHCTRKECCLWPFPDGSGCSEPNVQCVVGSCKGGKCIKTPFPDGSPCDDNNQCTKDSCQVGICVSIAVPDNTPCNDGSYCTDYDICLEGVCKGTPIAQCP